MWTYYRQAIRFILLGIILIVIGLLYPHTIYHDRVADGKIAETIAGQTKESELMTAVREGNVYIDNSGRLMTIQPDLCKNAISIPPGSRDYSPYPSPSPGGR
jgi:hypothetical protein